MQPRQRREEPSPRRSRGRCDNRQARAPAGAMERRYSQLATILSPLPRLAGVCATTTHSCGRFGDLAMGYRLLLLPQQFGDSRSQE